MSAEVVWAGWLVLFLVYEITAALREKGTPARLTLSRNVWLWFDRPGEKVFLGVFMLTLTAHLTFGTPGAVGVIVTGAPVAGIIAWSLLRPRRASALLILALPLLLGADRCSISWPQPGPSPTASPTAEPTAPPTAEPTPGPTAEPTPTPPPPPAACSIDGEPGPPIAGYKNLHGDAVNAAMHRLRPDCEVGGTCVLDVDRQEWQAQVIAELRAARLCAGQHAPDTDEIAVSTSTTAPREGWHVFAGGGGARRTVVWAPQAARGAYAAPAGPAPTPTATPGPTAPPTAPPAGDGCGDPAPPPAVRINVKIHTAFCANLDSTILVRDAAYCARVGFPNRQECPVRPEGAADRAACEARLRGPTQTWRCEGAGCQVFSCDQPGNCACGTHVNTNPAQAIVTGHGRVITCTADGKACGSVNVP